MNPVNAGNNSSLFGTSQPSNNLSTNNSNFLNPTGNTTTSQGNNSTSNLFGAKPAENNPSSLFAAKPAENNPSSLFGAKPAENNSSSLFGAKPAENNSSSLFGAKPAENNSTSLFGAKPAENNSSSLFGAKPAENNSSSLFGAKPAENNSSTLFGAKPAENKSNNPTGQPISSNIFGGQPNPSNNPPNSLFDKAESPSKQFTSSFNPLTSQPNDPNKQSSPSKPLPNTPESTKTLNENIQSFILKQRADYFLKESKFELEKQFYRFKDISKQTLEFEKDNYLIYNDLIKLHENIKKMNDSQNTINDELSIIEAEQQSYNEFLDTINRELNNKCSHLFRFNIENSLYEKSADVSIKIGELEANLQEMVKKMNQNSEPPDPFMTEVEENLDALFDSLNWIENKIVRNM